MFDRLRNEWETWSGTMLPERLQPATYTNAGELLADHYGVTNPPRPAHGGAAAAAQR